MTELLDYKLTYFKDIFEKLFEDYINANITDDIISYLRKEIQSQIILAKEKCVDISNLFPLTLNCKNKYVYKFFESGHVYKHLSVNKYECLYCNIN